jgi:hypothetical protein
MSREARKIEPAKIKQILTDALHFLTAPLASAHILDAGTLCFRHQTVSPGSPIRKDKS